MILQPSHERPSSCHFQWSLDHIDVEELVKKIEKHGNQVQSLKSSNAANDAIEKAVADLLALKAQFKVKTGQDLPAGGRLKKKEKKKYEGKKKKE